MPDRPEIVRPESKASGLNINKLLLSLPGTSGNREEEAADFYRRIGLTPAEYLLGLVSTEEKEKKYSIPARLAQAVKDIDDYDEEKRKKATETLMLASLKELVDIRYKAENLTQGRKIDLDKLIQAKAKERWKECGGDPRRLGREARDPKVAEALILCAPDELKNCRDTEDEFWKFMFLSGPHTVRKYEIGLEKLERIAAFSEMVERVAASIDAGEKVMDIAAEHKKQSIWHHAKAFAMAIHSRLSNADPDLVSDAAELSKETREDDAKAARRTYLEIVDSKKFDIYKTVFWQHTSRFLDDKTIDDNLYVETVRKLADNAIDTGKSESNVDCLFMLLGQSDGGTSKTKQKELDKQFERTSVVLEERLASIEEPEKLVRKQMGLIQAYLICKQREKSLDKAKAMYARVLETIARLPEDQRQWELKLLNDFERTYKVKLK